MLLCCCKAVSANSDRVQMRLADVMLDVLYADIGHLTEKQEQSLNAFKALCSAQGLYKTDPPSHDDATLLRWAEDAQSRG